MGGPAGTGYRCAASPFTSSHVAPSSTKAGAVLLSPRRRPAFSHNLGCILLTAIKGTASFLDSPFAGAYRPSHPASSHRTAAPMPQPHHTLPSPQPPPPPPPLHAHRQTASQPHWLLPTCLPWTPRTTSTHTCLPSPTRPYHSTCACRSTATCAPPARGRTASSRRCSARRRWRRRPWRRRTAPRVSPGGPPSPQPPSRSGGVAGCGVGPQHTVRSCAVVCGQAWGCHRWCWYGSAPQLPTLAARVLARTWWRWGGPRSTLTAGTAWGALHFATVAQSMQRCASCATHGLCTRTQA